MLDDLTDIITDMLNVSSFAADEARSGAQLSRSRAVPRNRLTPKGPDLVDPLATVAFGGEPNRCPALAAGFPAVIEEVMRSTSSSIITSRSTRRS